MNKCHILLGRPWQHDVNATHKGKENMYMFTWRGKRVVMRPISPTSKSTKEKASKLVSMNNRGKSRYWDQTFPQAEFAKDSHVHGLIDWHSRTSSFEKRGTDVRRQSKNLRFNSGPDRSLSKPVKNIGRLPDQLIDNREQTGEATQTIGRPSIDWPEKESRDRELSLLVVDAWSTGYTLLTKRSTTRRVSIISYFV